MLKIRLQRVGRRHEPAFRIVVTESSRAPKSNNFIEILGSYDPRQKDKTKIEEERIKYWISKGAQVSDTIHNLLITKGVIEGKKINVLPKKRPQVSGDENKEEVENKEKTVTEKEEENKEESDVSEDTSKEDKAVDDSAKKEEEVK